MQAKCTDVSEKPAAFVARVAMYPDDIELIKGERNLEDKEGSNEKNME
jgi:hypothetical protein